MVLPEFTNLEELEGLAKLKMEKSAFDYYSSGSDDQISRDENREAWKRLRLVPRALVNVSRIDTSSHLLGCKLDFPVLVPPMAMQCLAHPEGEIGMAKAAAKHGIPMVLSTMATCSLGEIAAVQPAPILFFQIYVTRDRHVTQSLIQEAEALGYNALMVTVDAPYLGKREADVKNRFALPDHLHLKNLVGRLNTTGLARQGEFTGGSALAEAFAKELDASLSWDAISWIRTICRLPIFVKGILSPDDAMIAVEHGVDGIVVSNHGGRQLDTALSTCSALPGIVHSVGRRIPVLVDGGIRRGTDIVKALSMGASGVLVGRPMLYGLALGGEEGVCAAIEKLKEEFVLALALCGCASLSDISPRLIAPHQENHIWTSRL